MPKPRKVSSSKGKVAQSRETSLTSEEADPIHLKTWMRKDIQRQEIQKHAD